MFLGEYKGNKIKLAVRHIGGCGYVYKVRPDHFLYSDSRCPRCNGNRVEQTPEEFAAEVYEVFGDEYTVIGNFTNRVNNVLIRHNEPCGCLFSPQPRLFTKGLWGCPKCANLSRSRKPIEKILQSFEEDVRELVGDEYEFLDEYVGSQVKMRVLHTGCGKVFKTTQNKFFIQGSRCPNCVYSRGEKVVADVLDSLSIEYTREHTFEYLGRKRYDFFIPSLNIAIEYDGEQHYEPVDAWGGEEYLESVRQSDALKNDFCEYMGIDLLRIPYWEFDNIDEIVTNFIDTVKLMRSISANSSEMAKCR